ncbi:MAG: hypothetical protein JNL74_08930 [Fibrobacteres bacterium]|nr:hypothetical protein [Fibrobacterota bacterium]
MLIFTAAVFSAVDISDSNTETSMWPYFAASAVIPGSGQIVAGKRLKGGALLALEAILVSSCYNDGFYLTGRLKDKIADADHKLKASFTGSESVYYKGEMVAVDSLSIIEDKDDYTATRNYYSALGWRTLAFATGVYITNLVDCRQTVGKNKELLDRSATGAYWRSMLFPGWGQLYNGKPVKACMALTALAGLGVNIVQWNKLGGIHEDRSKDFDRHVTILDSRISGLDSTHTVLKDSLTADRGRLKSTADRELAVSSRYYSRRNENIWYALAIYLFASFDAVVDAHLTGFDKKIEFSCIPESNGGIKLSASIPVKP